MEPNTTNQPTQPTAPVIPQSVAENPLIQPNQTVNQEPQSSRSKTKYILIAALILFVFAVAGISAYYLGVVKKQPKPSSISSTTLDETSNWKTFTSNKYKFSLKYPSNLSVQVIDKDPLGSQIYFYDAKIGTPSGVIINANIFSDFFASYLPEWILFKDLYASPSGSIIVWNNEVFGNQQFVKGMNRSLDGYKAFDYTRHSLPINSQNLETGVGAYVELPQQNILLIESSEDKKSRFFRKKTPHFFRGEVWE